MIPLTTGRPIGPMLRDLRHRAGLTTRQVARRAHISPGGVHKRETSHASYLDMLTQHAQALGYTVAFIPTRHPGARNTGTGWPT